MATQSPFHFLERVAQSLATRFPAPDWMVEEVQRRIVLLLNHVLMQEKAAMARLTRQKGRVVLVQWNAFSICFLVTPAGLLDLAPAHTKADLVLAVADDSLLTVAQSVLRGDKPSVRIEGDVQLAAEVNWLVDNVRWDLEEDLSRIIGDAPAHTVGEAARAIANTLRQFTRAPVGAPDSSGPSA